MLKEKIPLNHAKLENLSKTDGRAELPNSVLRNEIQALGVYSSFVTDLGPVLTCVPEKLCYQYLCLRASFYHMVLNSF